MSQIAELQVYSKQMQPQLNAPGTAGGWLHLLDPNAPEVVIHQTAIRADRNNQTVWSGPIFKTNETTAASTGSQSGSDQLSFTAMGWLQVLNQREVHTGAEFQAMLAGPNGIAWQAQNGVYSPLGVDQATTLAYSVAGNPLTTDAAIIFDLLDRANIDSPTGITKGNIYGNPVQRNLTLQRFQNVGQQITQLVNVEAGCDIYIDPVTRQMNLYGPGASSSPSISNGLGVDRGPQTRFTVPGNCISATRSRDGTLTANRLEAVGQYGVGRADAIESQAINGLFEATDSLSDVVDPNILIAYANVEVTLRQYPWTIISVNPRGLNWSDADGGSVPRPYDDYTIGDIVYAVINRGSFQAGTSQVPQATRIFGWTLGIDDNNSIEKLTSIQTTYQGLGSG